MEEALLLERKVKYLRTPEHGPGSPETSVEKEHPSANEVFDPNDYGIAAELRAMAHVGDGLDDDSADEIRLQLLDQLIADLEAIHPILDQILMNQDARAAALAEAAVKVAQTALSVMYGTDDLILKREGKQDG